MDDIWYNNPGVLLSNLNEFYPSNDLTRVEKINAIARLAVYYIILINKYDFETNKFKMSASRFMIYLILCL
jgi:hypothetical protein